MSKKCEVCGKGQVSGNRVSHSNRHTRRKWNANIQSVRLERLTFVPDVSGQTRLPVPTNFVWTCCTFLVQFFIA